MDVLFPYIQQYGLNASVVFAGLVVLFYLVRSFRRHHLLTQGQARLVIEQFDDTTARFGRLIKFLIVFVFVPMLVYVLWLAK